MQLKLNLNMNKDLVGEPLRSILHIEFPTQGVPLARSAGQGRPSSAALLLPLAARSRWSVFRASYACAWQEAELSRQRRVSGL